MPAIAPQRYTILVNNGGPSGMAEHTLRMTRTLAAAGYTVTLIDTMSAYLGPFLTDLPVKYAHIPLPENLSTGELRRRWSQAIAPDPGGWAIYARGRAGEGSIGILRALRSRFDRVYTVDHSPPPPNGWEGRPRGTSLLARLRYVLRDRAAVACVYRAVAVSSDVRRKLHSIYHYPPGKTAAACNSVDADRFVPNDADRAALRAEHGLSPGTFLVGSISRLDWEKRLDLLVRGFAEFARGYKGSTKLVLCGGGPHRDRLAKLVTDLGVMDRTIMPGYVPDTARWHRAFDAEVLTSNVEGGPITMLESMACGGVYLANPVGDVPDCIVDGVNGFVVDMPDEKPVAVALARIAALTAEQRRAIGTAARQRILERHVPAIALARLCEALDAPDAVAYLKTHGYPAPQAMSRAG